MAAPQSLQTNLLTSLPLIIESTGTTAPIGTTASCGTTATTSTTTTRTITTNTAEEHLLVLTNLDSSFYLYNTNPSCWKQYTTAILTT